MTTSSKVPNWNLKELWVQVQNTGRLSPIALKGQNIYSPGQRPGNDDRLNISALKGHNKPIVVQFVPPFQGFEPFCIRVPRALPRAMVLPRLQRLGNQILISSKLCPCVLSGQKGAIRFAFTSVSRLRREIALASILRQPHVKSSLPLQI